MYADELTYIFSTNHSLKEITSLKVHYVVLRNFNQKRKIFIVLFLYA